VTLETKLSQEIFVENSRNNPSACRRFKQTLQHELFK